MISDEAISEYESAYEAEGLAPVTAENVTAFLKDKADQMKQSMDLIPRILPIPFEHPIPDEEELEHYLSMWSKAIEGPAADRSVANDFTKQASANQDLFIDLRLAYLYLCQDNDLVVKSWAAYTVSHKEDMAPTFEEQIPHAIHAYQQDSLMGWAANDLAWDLAAHSDKTKRDGAAAVTLAVEACQKTDWRYWGFIDTLAAALAQAGQYDDAVRVAKAAKELAPKDEQAYMDEAISLYETKQSQ